MSNRRSCVAWISAFALASCSSTPREFTAQPKAPPPDAAAFEQIHESCRVQVAQGRRSGFGGQLASGAAGTAVAVGTGAAMVGSAGSSMFAAAAAASMAVMVMPVVGIGAAWGLAKAKKKKKEREVKTAMALCLNENGYPVEGWKLASKQERKERRAADRDRRASKRDVADQKAPAPEIPVPAPAVQPPIKEPH